MKAAKTTKATKATKAFIGGMICHDICNEQ